MRLSETSKMNASINVTPLVDVVLVLLIIFMVVVPLLLQGYDVDIPRTSAEAVPARPGEGRVVLAFGPTACPILGPPRGGGPPPAAPWTLKSRGSPRAA